MSNHRRHMSETSADLREISMSNLEARLNIEMKHPIKKFGGLNSIRMCGRRARIILGENPKALILTGLMINVPATYFNTLIAPSSLWGDFRYGLTTFGVLL